MRHYPLGGLLGWRRKNPLADAGGYGFGCVCGWTVSVWLLAGRRQRIPSL